MTHPIQSALMVTDRQHTKTRHGFEFHCFLSLGWVCEVHE